MNSRPFRSFGIVPAAGASKRMGSHKLLLPYQGRALIERVLSEWKASRVDRTVVVLNQEDEQLINKCERSDVICVFPKPLTVEMKHSVQAALTWIQLHMAPRDNDAWLLAPADLPRLSSRIIDRVINSYDPGDPKIVVPRHGQRRGHPAMFPWSYSSDVHRLQKHQGVNRLYDRYQVTDIPMDASEILQDLNTPEDYQKLMDE